MLKILIGLSVLVYGASCLACDTNLGENETWKEARPKWQCMVETLQEKNKLIQERDQALHNSNEQIKALQTKLADATAAKGTNSHSLHLSVYQGFRTKDLQRCRARAISLMQMQGLLVYNDSAGFPLAASKSDWQVMIGCSDKGQGTYVAVAGLGDVQPVYSLIEALYHGMQDDGN